MASWGLREHKAENKTSFLLLIGAMISGFFIFFRLDWLVWGLAIWTLLTFVVHLYARFSHIMEKHTYKKASWTPRGRNK
jgi:uncharacterized membrane protein